jgi:hypothetical protein
MALDQAQYFANARAIYDWWRARGMSHVFACAMLAQADAESSLDPSAIGDHDEAFGLHQLHMDRIKLIRDGDKQWPGRGIDISKLPAIPPQLDAVFWELRHSEQHALTEILAATTAVDAGAAASRFYERPGANGQAEKRGQLAQKWDAYFQQRHGEG